MSLKIGENKRFDYTGSIQSIQLLPGEYLFEVYGAKGGGTYGAKGGYAKGNIMIYNPIVIYIICGGIGKYRAGGYNGGGGIYTGGDYGGGGATHIATMSGILQTLSSNKDSVLIVAGGGGGGSQSSGGSGGGINGLNGASNGSGYTAGKGGTQTSGGAYGTGGGFSGQTSGSFGQGGNGYGNWGSGGGGGWYGGGGGLHWGGGGGSGYIGGVINGEMKTGINSTNGYAIITMLNEINIRRNSNYYRDSYYQEHFDFNKLIGGD